MARRLTRYKSRAAFRQANAYRHMHGIKSKIRNVRIRGKVHKVKK